MEVTQQFYTDFEQNLDSLNKQLQDFVSVLMQERKLLETNELTALEELNNIKQNNIAKIEGLQTELNNLFSHHNLEVNKDNITKLVKTIESNYTAKLTKKWQQVLELLKTVDEANLVNGVIIINLNNQYKNIMQLITNTSNQTELYNNSSKNSNQSMSTREHKV